MLVYNRDWKIHGDRKENLMDAEQTWRKIVSQSQEHKRLENNSSSGEVTAEWHKIEKVNIYRAPVKSHNTDQLNDLN